MARRPPRRRTDYEMELSHLLTEDLGCYVEHVGKTSGWDLIVAAPVKDGFNFVPIEVKTSVNTIIYLGSSKQYKEQFKGYRRIHHKYGIPTIYAFRHITRAHVPVREKWRFFKANKYKLSFTKGYTWKQLMKELLKGGYL
jgi:hypothetical protein